MPSTAQNSHLEIQSTNPNVHCWVPIFISISTYYGDITNAAVSILTAKLSWFSRAVLKSVFRIRDTVLIVTHINFKLKTLDQGNNSRLCVFHVGILSSFQNLKFGRCPSGAALPALPFQPLPFWPLPYTQILSRNGMITALYFKIWS